MADQLDRNRPVVIRQGRRHWTVSYGQAVTLVSRGLAAFKEDDQMITSEGTSHRKPAPGSGPEQSGPPPRSGAGSGREAWAVYAIDQGNEIDEGMTRDDIINELQEASDGN